MRLRRARPRRDDFDVSKLVVADFQLLVLLRGQGTSTQRPDSSPAAGSIFRTEAEVDDRVGDEGEVGGPDEEDLVLELIGKQVELLEPHRGFDDALKLEDVHWRSVNDALKLFRHC